MPLFGGIAGQFPSVITRHQPTVQCIRAIPGPVWWNLLHWPWRQYLAAIATGTASAVPPELAPPGAIGVYVTDRASMRGCDSPADFAWRRSLSAQDQQDCQLFGCAVIRFDLPHAAALLLPAPLPGVVPGLTGGGAREWLLAGNIDLDATMRVDYVERTAQGSRHYHLPL